MSLATWICYPSLLWQVTITFAFPLSLSLCPKLSLHLGSCHDPSLPKSNITAERDWQKSLFALPFLISVTYNMIKCHVMSRWTSFEPKRPSSRNFIENFSTKWPRQSAKVSPLFSISVRESHKDLSCCSVEIRAPTPTPVVSPLHPRADRNTPFICPFQENHPHLDSSGLQSRKEAMEWVSHRAERCLTPLPTREVPVQQGRWGAAAAFGVGCRGRSDRQLKRRCCLGQSSRMRLSRCGEEEKDEQSRAIFIYSALSPSVRVLPGYWLVKGMKKKR